MAAHGFDQEALPGFPNGVVVAWRRRAASRTATRVVANERAASALQVDLRLADGRQLTVVGCYRPPGAGGASKLVERLRGVRGRTVLAVGDFNLAPLPEMRRGGEDRRLSAAEAGLRDFAGLGEEPGLAFGRLVDLGLEQGRMSRVDWATGEGTATLDHFIAAGALAESWRAARTRLVRAARGPDGREGRLLGDHVMAVAQWSAGLVEAGVEKRPVADRSWGKRAWAAFGAEWAANAPDLRRSAARGADRLEELMTALRRAKVEAAVTHSEVQPPVRGAGVKGLAAQIGRVRGTLRVCRRAMQQAAPAAGLRWIFRPDNQHGPFSRAPATLRRILQSAVDGARAARAADGQTAPPITHTPRPQPPPPSAVCV